MTNTRTSKYKDLRNRLQNDTDDGITTRDLQQYEKRLNQINAETFAAPEEYNPEEHDPIHARRKQYLEGDAYPEGLTAEKEDTLNVPLSSSAVKKTDFLTGSFNNEYLDEYIKEVKQYNVEQGNAFSADTDVNILRSLREERPIPTKPFLEEEKPALNKTTSLSADDVIGLNTNTLDVLTPVKEESAPTADVPMFQPKEVNDFSEFVKEDEAGTETLTKEDIANEVQNLIREQNKPLPEISTKNTKENSFDNHFAAEATARQQLLNETTQMRAQLDSYEDNLTEVSDKMNRTNQVLNVVLIVLIIALLVVLAVVLYWIFTSRGGR